MTEDKEAAREGYARRKADDPGPVTVRTEPRIYGPGGEYSFFRDIALAALHGDPGATQARSRLDRHRTEVDGEIRADSNEGRRARAIRDRESRAATTSTIAGFTTPLWLTEQWVEFRSQNRSFVDTTQILPLPSYGMQINVPSFTSSTPSAQQTTETSGVSDSSPSGSAITQSIVTIASEVPISQQLYDQGGMTGLSFDQIVIAQVRNSIDKQVDNYALSQVIAGAGTTITDNSAFSIANFYADVAKARESLADTAGTRLKATHIFSTTDIFSYITRQVDDQHRPIVTPDWAAEPWSSLKAMGDSSGDGWLGHILPGDIAWFSDDNTPSLSGNAQFIVSRPNSVLTFESDIVSFAYPENSASTLTVMVGIREYVCVVARYANAHVIITGSAYATTEV
jgi:hypothetical protein